MAAAALLSVDQVVGDLLLAGFQLFVGIAVDFMGEQGKDAAADAAVAGLHVLQALVVVGELGVHAPPPGGQVILGLFPVLPGFPGVSGKDDEGQQGKEDDQC